MTLIYTEGFDYYSTAAPTDNTTGLHLGKRYLLNSTSSSITGTYMTIQPGFEGRGGCLRSNTTNSVDNNIIYVIGNYGPSPMTQLCFGMYYQTNSTTSSVIRFQNTGTTQSFIELILNLNSNLSIISTSDTINGSLVGNASASTFPVNTWMYVEVVINISGSTASVQVYQENSLVINLPSLNWYGSGNGVFGIEQIFFGKSTYARINNRLQYFDHCYMTTGERLGPTEIRSLLPSADTAQKQWSPSTGTTNFNLVNETTISSTSPGMTTLVSASTNGYKDYYSVSGTIARDSGAQIKAVQPYIFASSPGSYSEIIDSNIKSGSTESIYDISVVPYTGNTFLYRVPFLTTNPNTSSPWTYLDLQSMQLGLGYKSTTNYQNILFSWIDNTRVNNTTATATLGTIPSYTNNYNVFNGTTNIVAYNNTSNAFDITTSYSVEFDLYFTSTSPATFNQWIFNIGPAYDNGRPVFSIRTILPATGLITQAGTTISASIWPTAGTDAGEVDYSFVGGGGNTITSLAYDTNYSIGIMFYNNGSDRMRGYCNGIQQFDVSMPAIRAPGSTYGISIGGSNPTYSYTYFKGGLRNLRVGRSAFWSI